MTPPPLYIGSRRQHGRRHIASYESKVRYTKNKERIPPAAAINISFSYLLRAGSISRVAGATPQTLLYLLYIAPRVHSLRGVFYVSQSRPSTRPSMPAVDPSCLRQPCFPHTKNAARKNAAKSKHKKHCKKIFIFLIILHIKYEDKKARKKRGDSSRRQNRKK